MGGRTEPTNSGWTLLRVRIIEEKGAAHNPCDIVHRVHPDIIQMGSDNPPIGLQPQHYLPSAEMQGLRVLC